MRIAEVAVSKTPGAHTTIGVMVEVEPGESPEMAFDAARAWVDVKLGLKRPPEKDIELLQNGIVVADQAIDHTNRLIKGEMGRQELLRMLEVEKPDSFVSELKIPDEAIEDRDNGSKRPAIAEGGAPESDEIEGECAECHAPRGQAHHPDCSLRTPQDGPQEDPKEVSEASEA